MMRARSLVLVVAMLTCGALSACSASSAGSNSSASPTVSTVAPEVRAFYEVAAGDVAGAPGTVLRTQPVTAPAGAQGWRVLYRSRSVSDAPIVTSGLVFVPVGAAPAGGRPVVAWAHETTGIADDCAPSRSGEPTMSSTDLRALLTRGYVVTATDYEGLGTTGTHPYLVGASEARSVLDSVRAAHAMSETGAGTRAAIYGYSQGGHATLFAAQYASSYAPELSIVGSVAVAPPADLSQVPTQLATDRELYGFGVLAAFGLHAAYPNQVPLDAVLAREVVDQSEVVETTCSQLTFFALASRPLEKVFNPSLVSNPTVAKLLAESSAGAAPPEGPVLIINGGKDTLATPAMVERYIARVCAQGASVEVLTKPDRDHGGVARDDFATAGPWIDARFTGAPVPPGCPVRLPA
ncbi:MAG: lipase family protein [Acidimicrobiia bacterium]